MNWVSKYKIDILKVLAAITIVVIAVMGWNWTDTANRTFWANFWIVAAIAALVLWVTLWIIFSNKKRP